MEIHLIRHTKPMIESNICYGQSDLALAPTHQADIKQTLSKLDKSADIVYSSPLVRCRTLANAISNQVTIDARLMELNFGSWEMQEWSDLPKSELNPWMEDFINIAPPSGESFKTLSERVTAFLVEIFAQKHDEVILVTHAGVIRATIAFILGLSLANAFRLTVDYGSVSGFSLNEGVFKLNYLNR